MAKKLKQLNEQVIVVTGASSGIGLATAQRASAQGAKVVLAARSVETLNDLVSVIEQTGGQAVAVAADVSNRDDLERVANAAIEHFGRIDTWINNAGVAIFGRLDQVSERDSRRLFDINFWGVVNGSLVALPALRASGGALINVGSEVSDAVAPLQGMYSASKHAVKGFTDALRIEVEQLDHAGTADGREYALSAAREKLHEARAQAADAANRSRRRSRGNPRRRDIADARREGRRDGKNQHHRRQGDAQARRQAGRQASRSPAIR
jgi:NADP-dependent 3-hydroxy acid dehydrogenase YdfG